MYENLQTIYKKITQPLKQAALGLAAVYLSITAFPDGNKASYYINQPHNPFSQYSLQMKQPYQENDSNEEIKIAYKKYRNKTLQEIGDAPGEAIRWLKRKYHDYRQEKKIKNNRKITEDFMRKTRAAQH